MKSIIRIEGLADGRASDIDGTYLASYDNEHENELGVGTIYTVTTPGPAKHFDDFTAAWEFWKQVSLTVPVRPDGKLNRPLTAFNITIVPVAK